MIEDIDIVWLLIGGFFITALVGLIQARAQERYDEQKPKQKWKPRRIGIKKR